MDFYAIPELIGDLVQLEPLSVDHAPELAEAIAENDLYTTWVARLPAPENMLEDIETRLNQNAEQQAVPWAIRRISDGRAVGVTTFLHIRPEDRRLEIGSTWIASSAQGTGINAESKLLLLTYAFETLGCIAVEFRTHWHNRRSRAAIAALGAKQDGVLRNHDVWQDGTVRDVVVFSIIDREWPTVRLGLREKVRSFTE
ncbi:GNAT family N-acetyltransferase [Kocuria sp. WRN011]|uniref:GNAT family protein n=1 Tax=Kocuria carniphila TaxID=262208 RepID=A0ABV3V235_9MICC|nr:GNAT family protein [Kocuria sp. WRN011]PBB09862.1 GNAT family N-acetyltransferase [Kocuria sp. WRN011]